MSWYDVSLAKGTINQNLLLRYIFSFESEGKFQTISQLPNGTTRIRTGYMLSFDDMEKKERLIIPGQSWFPFVSLFRRSIKLISDHLFDLFPNMNRIEFEMDTKTIERFQTEKALSTGHMAIVPCVWTTQEGECYPGMRIETPKGSISIPFEDGIAFSEALNHTDPTNLEMGFLHMIGKFDE